MRTLLLPALFALGIGLTGTGRIFRRACGKLPMRDRVVTQCDRNGKTATRWTSAATDQIHATSHRRGPELAASSS